MCVHTRAAESFVCLFRDAEANEMKDFQGCECVGVYVCVCICVCVCAMQFISSPHVEKHDHKFPVRSVFTSLHML